MHSSFENAYKNCIIYHYYKINKKTLYISSNYSLYFFTDYLYMNKVYLIFQIIIQLKYNITVFLQSFEREKKKKKEILSIFNLLRNFPYSCNIFYHLFWIIFMKHKKSLDLSRTNIFLLSHHFVCKLFCHISCYIVRRLIKS